MNTDLTATFEFLAKTENEAAVDVLAAGLDCSHKVIQRAAVRALLDRRSPQGHQEVFRRLDELDQQCREIVKQRPERLADVVGSVLQDPESDDGDAACDAIAQFALYESLPMLVKVLLDVDRRHIRQVSKTILKLSESFYAELSGVAEGPKHKQQDILRERITACLEDAVRRFHRHEQMEVMEAFLLIVKPKNSTLLQLLQGTDNAAHQAAINVLSNSPRGGVIRLLLAFLEEPQIPRPLANVICYRSDAKFVDCLGRSVGTRPSKTMAAVLGRFALLVWAQPGHEVFDHLSEPAEEGVVNALMASAIHPSDVLPVIGHILLEGQPAGRRAAAVALAEFDDREAASYVLRAVNDEDPQVRARVIVQLRQRGIPGALSLLMRMADSPEKEVKRALRKAMPEFTFQQFLENYEQIPEQSLAIAGHLVRNLDPDVAQKVLAEMKVLSPVRRRRAVTVAGTMGLVPRLEEDIVKLLTDDDHMVRVAAAQTLAEGKSAPAWEALRDALLDRSFVVKEAAERSLEQISRSLLQNLARAEKDRDAEDRDAEDRNAEDRDAAGDEQPQQQPQQEVSR